MSTHHAIIHGAPQPRLAELHSHLGASVAPSILWSIAHDQGMKLPTKDFWEFEKMVVIKEPFREGQGVRRLDEKYYKLCELIQSSPTPLFNAVRGVIGGAYRANNIVVHELRFNPAKRNRAGERDLDYIIISVINGMERAVLEFPAVSAGVIIEFDRNFNYQLNTTLYEKACKYQGRGIIGIDIAGPQNNAFHIEEYVDLLVDAKRRGFGVTIHTGEEGGRMDEMNTVVEKICPQRIGHGILAARDKKLMAKMVERGIALELCPTSNLNIGIFANWAELRKTYRALYDAGVVLTVNTDGPEMHNTNLNRELQLLQENGVFTAPEIEQIVANAFQVTFVKSNEPNIP
ncbi:MAG: adenosine deaminase [Patescibacteria group bacterium]|nr:adenosine deaminase [Patescibacteria group bacterium]